MNEHTHLIPYRENRSVKATVAPAVIAVDDDSLPTSHPVGAYLARLSIGSRDTMQRGLACALCAVNEGTQLAEVDYETSRFYHRQVWVTEWHKTNRDWMYLLYPALDIAGYAPYTRQRIVTAVRGVLKECRFMKLMSADDYFAVTENMPKISADAPPAGRAVDLDEYLRLLEVCDLDPNEGAGRVMGRFCRWVISPGRGLAKFRDCEWLITTLSSNSLPSASARITRRGTFLFSVTRRDEWMSDLRLGGMIRVGYFAS